MTELHVHLSLDCLDLNQVTQSWWPRFRRCLDYNLRDNKTHHISPWEPRAITSEIIRPTILTENRPLRSSVLFEVQSSICWVRILKWDLLYVHLEKKKKKEFEKYPLVPLSIGTSANNGVGILPTSTKSSQCQTRIKCVMLYGFPVTVVHFKVLHSLQPTRTLLTEPDRSLMAHLSL